MSAPFDGAPADHLDELGPDGAPLVVVVHGVMDRAESFLRLARRLRSDTRVVCYDRRGYARSCQLSPAHGLDTHVEDLAEVLQRCGPAVLFGHSLGGVVALALAARRPDLVRGVATYEAPALWEPWWPTGLAGGWALAHEAEGGPAVAEGFMRRVIGERAWARLGPSVQDERRQEGTALLAELAAAREVDPVPAGGLSVPAVVAYGGRSDDAHQRAARELAVRLVAPLVRVEEAEHGAHLSHPDELAAVVRLAVGLAAVG